MVSTKNLPTLKSLLSNKKFRLHTSLFIVFNALLYGWIIVGHNLAPLGQRNYHVDAYHYIADTRVIGDHKFNLLSALGQFDAQWYLHNAGSGYPNLEPKYRGVRVIGVRGTPNESELSYAFLPTYPLMIRAVNVFFGNIMVSAFVLTQILLVVGFTAVYWLVLRWYDEGLATKATWLLFLYPFSIFYRSYFTEGIFLILLVVAMEALRSKKWFLSAISAGLLMITRFVGLAATLVMTYELLFSKGQKRPGIKKVIGYIAISFVPLLSFAIYCYIKTGNPIYFVSVHKDWIMYRPPVWSTAYNLLHIFTIPWHSYRYSRIDDLSILVFGSLLFFSRRWLAPVWWRLSLIIFLIPILSADTMSASRYMIVNLPLFIYAAHLLNKRWQYLSVAALCLGGLLVVSILFSNWVWIG
jgi:hypothetical protein